MENHNGKNLIISIFLNIGIVVFEIVFGLLSRSMALISDALHNITDIGSMVLSWWGEKMSSWPSNGRKTYGYKRAEVIIAFTNGGILLAVTIFIVFEAIQRIFHPTEVAGLQMMVVAGIALAGNGIATYLLEKDAHKNLNLKSAWLHSLQDAIFSLAVIVGAGAIYFTGWNWIDPALSILISAFLLKEIYKIVAESLNMMLDSVPSDIDFAEVQKTLAKIPEIKSLHDLHIWQTGSNNKYLSAHLKIAELNESERGILLSKLQILLLGKYQIRHSTLQMISEKESENIDLECEHCN
jgi:cobalt-zinc-cadmium efflux system protein